MINEIIKGQQTTWTLEKKLGEGDAGEVYLVQSLVGSRIGVLKRPQKSAFAGDVVRQAAQIRTEGIVLKALSALPASGSGVRISVPELLDQSKIGSDFGDRLFIVVERAPGFDLSFLARISKMGLNDRDEAVLPLSSQESILLKEVAQNGMIPERILLSCLSGLLEVLLYIHKKPVDSGSSRAAGIIYNDIKPEHLFWYPQRAALKIIDWGNAQFIDQDGMSRDRQHSVLDDFRQYVEEMGKFLASTSPELHVRLDWPTHFDLGEDLYKPEGLFERINAALQEELQRISLARQAEDSLHQPGTADEGIFPQLEAVQKQLLAMGEIPDYRGASRFAGGYATSLVINEDIAALQNLSDWAARLPGEQVDQWRLVSHLAEITLRSQGESCRYFRDALQAAICMNGEGVLWNLTAAVGDAAEPNWWFELVGQVRRMALGFEADALLPLVAANRLMFSMKMQARQMEDSLSPRRLENHADVAVVNLDEMQRLQHLARRLQEDVIETWTWIDPPPPNAGLDYSGLSVMLHELGDQFSAERQQVERLLERPAAQVKVVLTAWERREFVAASQALRKLLLWDPDRRRVLRADQLILSAPGWLMKIHLGPQEGEHFQDFGTNLEFEGRELRNHVGAAAWLDEILSCLAQLRKGVWPADVLASDPGIGRELPWLKKFERSERLPVEVKTASDEEVISTGAVSVSSTGLRTGVMGPEGDLRLLEPLDAWAPEARGSSARVYLGEQDGENDAARQVAVKLLRMDKPDYAVPLFCEEVRILTLMDQVPGISRMLECGFIHLEGGWTLPSDSDLEAVCALKGELLRIGLDASQDFLDQINQRVEEGWTPYLTIEKQEKENNLLFLCDAGLTHGQYLPLINLLQMSIQICDILQAAHDRNIVYRDHKILHYYWLEPMNGVYLIDWNVARLHPDGLTEYEKKMDLVQFGARGLHHILTGRSAPGSLPLGPTRPEEIEHAAESYHTQWTYDDQRLSQGLRDIVEAVLAGGYARAAILREDLKKTYVDLPYSTSSDTRKNKETV